MRDFEVLRESAKSRYVETFTIDPRENGPFGSLWSDGPPAWCAKAFDEWNVALKEIGLDLP